MNKSYASIAHVALAVLALAAAACTSETSSAGTSSETPALTERPGDGTPPKSGAAEPESKHARCVTRGEEPRVDPYVVLIRGTLAGDVATSKATHDGLAGAGETQAIALGDVGHFTFLGAQDQEQFLSIDRWTSLDGLHTFFSNPEVAAAFGGLYTAPPSVDAYSTPKGWVTWGSLDYRSHGQVVAVTIHGHAASADENVSRANHNAAAGGAKAFAQAQGDVAHIVLTGAQDARDIVFVDYWTNPAAPQTFYANPDLQAAFGSLFDGPPDIRIQVSSDWVQW